MELNTSEFYFGNAYDLKSQAIIPDTLTFYDPEDLTTHAVITGMTGSGKTGMGIILLEEAALRGIPAILIDPKGDLTNHLLHFPDFLPSDFAPWVDADAAKREGLTVEEAAEAAAASWKKGTERSGIDRDRMEKLSTNVDYVIYTPGSDSAIPVSILSSLKAPGIDWEENKEMLRESISSTVTALLELVGLTISTRFVPASTFCWRTFLKQPGAKAETSTWNLSSCRCKIRLLKNWVFLRSPSSTRKKTALNWRCS